MNLYAKILRNIAPELRIRDCGWSNTCFMGANEIDRLEAELADERGSRNATQMGALIGFLEAQLANAEQTIKQLEAALAAVHTMVPDPRCSSKGCKNIVESGEDWCTNCLDDMS